MSQFGDIAEPRYCALIGDVVASREISDRSDVQRRLRQLLDQLSQELDGSLAAPLALTAGDELQGLLRDPGAAVTIAVRLADDMFPVRIVHGLGWGQLTTQIQENVALVDGPAFHRARRALHSARRGRRWLVAAGFSARADAAVAAIFSLMDVIRSRWTPRQALYSRAVRYERQKDVAARYGVNRSVVSESLKSAAAMQLQEAEGAAASLLSEFCPPGAVGRGPKPI